MALRISQPLPPSGTPARYEVYRGAASDDLALLDVVVFGAANLDATNRMFFYVDESGDTSYWYRVIAYDADNIILSDSGPYAYSPAVAANTPARVKVDHNYGAVDALRYVAGSGAGVPQAKVRVWKEADYLAARWDAAIAATETADDGRFVAPVYLEPGFSYVVEFSKEGLYGPDKATIVV